MPRILLVEDRSKQAPCLQRELLRYDLSVEVEGSGRRGLDAARRSQPDAIVLDVDLPEMDGYALCHSLKADPQTTRIPVLLLTPPEGGVDALAELAVGAVDAIPRDSFTAHNLIEALRLLGLL